MGTTEHRYFYKHNSRRVLISRSEYNTLPATLPKWVNDVWVLVTELSSLGEVMGDTVHLAASYVDGAWIEC